MTSARMLALAKLAARLDTLTDDAGDPIPWAITRSFCAPREGYCIWSGEKSFFRPSLTQAIRAANQHVRATYGADTVGDKS